MSILIFASILIAFETTEALSGLFTFRPSTTATITECDLEGLTSVERTEKWTCYSQCLQDPCCRALSLSDCSTANYFTEDKDFVKEIPGASPLPQPDCTCSVELGVLEGNMYSTLPGYAAGTSDITRLTLFMKNRPPLGLMPSGIEMEFTNGEVSSDGYSPSNRTCFLVPGERIKEVVAYIHETPSFLSGITFTTTHQTCGPFGLEESTSKRAMGHQLLFMGWYAENFIHAFIPHFDGDCISA